MRILGIDPGIGITGWSILRIDQPQPHLEAAGIITTTPNSPIPGRLVALHRELSDLLGRYEPTELAVEKLFFARNVTTAMTVSQARGVILLAGAQRALPVFEYTPLQVKMAITGYGKATKQQVSTMLRQHLRESIPKQDDAADAIAIALTHVTARTSVFA